MENRTQNDYEAMVLRIAREHRVVFHARTQEYIVGCTNDDKRTTYQLFYHKKHLHGLPAVAYHRQLNRQQVSGKVTVQPIGKAGSKFLGITPTDTEALITRIIGKLNYKSTGQLKTVWNTRGQRRSKA